MEFEGKIGYKLLTGKATGFLSHMNLKRVICTYKDGFYKEEFWANKNDNYYTKIYNSEVGKLFQINNRKQTIQERDLKDLYDPRISDIVATKTVEIDGDKHSCIQYKATYELIFGLLGQTITKAVLDEEIEFKLRDAKYCSVCSKHNATNNKISQYQETENNNRYASNKGIHQTDIQLLKIDCIISPKVYHQISFKVYH